MNRLYRFNPWLSMDEVRRMWLPLIFANQPGMFERVRRRHTITLTYHNLQLTIATSL